MTTLAVVFLLTGGTLSGPFIGNQGEDALMTCMRVLVEQAHEEPKYVGATLDQHGNPYGFSVANSAVRCFTSKEWPHD